MIKVGDRLQAKPVTFGERNKNSPKTFTGTVVYIHPKNRFLVLEFNIGMWGTIRESFRMVSSCEQE